MNGLQITGMKLSSPAPAKKTLPLKSTKPITTKPEPIQKKTSVATTTRSSVVSNTTKKPLTKQPVKAQTEKKQQKKIETPKQPEITKKVEEQKIQDKPKQSQTNLDDVLNEIAQEKTAPVQEEKKYEVVVKYNHYKEKFPVVNDVLQFDPVNEQYCFALVFKGNYQPILLKFPSREQVCPETMGTAPEFSWIVSQGETYVVEIEEDEEEQSKYEKKAYKAPQPQRKCCMKKNKQVQYLTQQMRQMGVEELGSQRHKELLQQRALEEILYS